MQNDYVFLTLLVISAVTIILRSLPIILTNKFKNNDFLIFISKKMPIGVMCLLVIYTLKGENYFVKPFGIPILIACATSILLYLYYKNALISIFVSLFIYLVIINHEFLLSYLEYN